MIKKDILLKALLNLESAYTHFQDLDIVILRKEIDILLDELDSPISPIFMELNSIKDLYLNHKKRTLSDPTTALYQKIEFTTK